MLREFQVTETHNLIVNTLKSKGYYDYRGGIQLFANQFDKNYSISINYMGTGVTIPIDSVIPEELEGNELIKICRTFECVL